MSLQTMSVHSSMSSLRANLQQLSARASKVVTRGFTSRRTMRMQAISGKTVVVTGASQGSGKAIAKAFAEHGANVCMISRDEENLQIAAKEIDIFARKHNSSVVAIPADVGDYASMNSAAVVIQTAFDSVDVVVNNAGICAQGPFEDTSMEIWDRVMKTNLMGAVHTTQLMLPLLQKSLSVQDGVKPTIINVNSFGGVLPLKLMTAYCASKYALQGFTDSLRLELPDMHVATVHPGIINSSFLERAQFVGKESDKTREQMETVLKMNGVAQQPSDIADAVLEAYGKEKREIVVGTAFQAATSLYSTTGVNLFALASANQ